MSEQQAEPDYKAVCERLDEAVREYTAVNLGRPGVMTGWVIFVASSRFGDDDELLHAYDYSVGPQMDLIRATGLVDLGHDLMLSHIRAVKENTESEDDA